MSTPPLPRHADLRKLAAARGRLHGAVALRELVRLRDALAQDGEDVMVTLRGAIDDEGYRCLGGEIHGSLSLQCQRCLGVVTQAVSITVSLALVWGEEEIPSLPSRFEGLVVGTDAVDLYDLVEEELLLALPLVARHPEGECSAGVLVDDAG